jgi:hypothetical protein
MLGITARVCVCGGVHMFIHIVYVCVHVCQLI